MDLKLTSVKKANFAKSFYSILDDCDGKDEFDQLILIIKLFKKYFKLIPKL